MILVENKKIFRCTKTNLFGHKHAQEVSYLFVQQLSVERRGGGGLYLQNVQYMQNMMHIEMYKPARRVYTTRKKINEYKESSFV